MASAPPETGSPPPRLMRKLVFALLSLIGFCTLILVILSYVVSLDRVKGKIVAHIEAALQRKVDVSTVRLQIVGGLGVGFEELTVYNPPGWQQAHLLNVETLSLKVARLPLLQRKIAITKIMLSNGDIVLEREPQGRLAFADHAEASADTTNISPALPLQPSRQTTVQPPASPITNLVVANVARKDVKFIYIDGKVIAGKAMTTTVSAGQLHLRDIALGTPSPCNMVATLVSNSRHNVRLHGNLGPIAANLTSHGVPVAGHLQATDVLLRQLIPCLGPEFSLIQGRIGTDVTVQGNLSGGLRINESLSLTDAMLWPALAEGASKALPKLTGTYDLTVDMARALVEMAAQLHLVSLQATMKGTVHNVRTIPQFDLHLTTNRFAPGELLAPLPILMPMLPTLAVPRASVQLQATLEGTPHNRHAEAEIDLDNITLKGGFFNGGMQDGGGRFLETDKTHATLTVDLMQPQPPNVQMDIRAQRLVFDQQAAKASAPSTDMPSGRTPRVVSSSHSP